MEPRLISVVMPVWNGERYLRESIDGILGQTFSDFEFIVIDDGSTDSTPEILRSYKDPRLRVFHLEHAGIVSSLNFGVAQAQAEWIARQDADDIALADRLDVQWNAVAKRPPAVLCYSEVEIIGDIKTPMRAPHFPRTRALLALKLAFQSPFTHGTVMFQKTAFNQAGGYRLEERHAEDYSLWSRMIEAGDFVGIPRKLIKLRVHHESVSRQNQDMQVKLTEKIGIRHCEKFLGLNRDEAHRAYAVLRAQPDQRELADWMWFLKRCVPNLRWKSAELYAWLASQTLRTLAARIKPKRGSEPA